MCLREESVAFEGVRVGDRAGGAAGDRRGREGKAKRVVTAGLDGGDVKPTSWKIDAGRSRDARARLASSSVRRFAACTICENAMLAIAVRESCGVSDESIANGNRSGCQRRRCESRGRRLGASR